MEPVVYRSGDLKAPGYFSGEPITKKQREYDQERIASTFAALDELVTEARPQLEPEHKQGQVLSGADAWRVGMVDDLVDAVLN